MQLDLSQSLEWNLVDRWTQGATPNPNRRNGFNPLPTFVVQSESPILAVGVQSPTARDTWWYAGRAYLMIPMSPSFTSEFGYTDVGRETCSIGFLTLCQFPRYLPSPYLLRFEPAKWLTSIILEIWRYDAFTP